MHLASWTPSVPGMLRGTVLAGHLAGHHLWASPAVIIIGIIWHHLRHQLHLELGFISGIIILVLCIIL